jgi:hypothetical protein
MYQVTSDEKDSLCFCDVSHLAFPDAKDADRLLAKIAGKWEATLCGNRGRFRGTELLLVVHKMLRASFLSRDKMVIAPPTSYFNYIIWICLKIVYIPNEIAIFHRDNDQQNHWV